MTEKLKQVPTNVTNFVDALPKSPGVYVFKNGEGEPLYVGKSRALRDRVQTYFRPTPRDRKTAHLRSLTKSIDVLLLNSDFQAREVETDLIRSYRPEYNSLYLDYMHRPLIKITRDVPYPTVEVVSVKDGANADYFGPYRSTRRLRRILDILGDCFQFRTCDLDISEGGDPEQFERCHRNLLDRCNAPCVGEESVDDYRERITELKEFLNGNTEPVLNRLRTRMNKYAKNHEYEAAGLVKEYLGAIEQLDQYKPFIRRTLHADVLHVSRNEPLFSELKVRNHRVQDVDVSRDWPQNTDEENRDRLSNRRVVASETTSGSLSIETSLPANDEEEALLTSLRKTTDFYEELNCPEASIRDRLCLKKDQLNRVVNGETVTAKLYGTSDSAHHRAVEHYSHYVEQGIPVPGEIEVIPSNRTSPPLQDILAEALKRISNSTKTYSKTSSRTTT